ncbi:MAG: phytoene dehydrogenase-like protein [Chlamydiales bacterium]|jgi:phytoene dehydrogenase-like protein
MGSTDYDTIIVGGGHNGLVCAAYLAKAGQRVLVLERRHVLGGAAVSEELHPGFTYSSCSYVVSLLRPWIIRDLELARFGLDLIPLESSFLPLPDGRSMCRWSDAALTREEVSAFSKRDAEVMGEFSQAMTKIGRFVRPIIDSPAPEPSSLNPGELMSLLRLGRHFSDASVDQMELRLKLLTMSAVDFLDEWFESEELKAPMSVSGIIGTFLGVRSPGTAYVLLHHYMGEIDGAFRSWGFQRGGTGGVSNAIADSARHFGAEIRTEAPVERILVAGGRATGVVLENGDEIRANQVVSGCDPRRTFLGFVGADHLPDEFVTSLKGYRFRGSSGKVNLSLDRLPEFSCRPGMQHLRGDIAIAPSIEYLERAYDEAKYGTFSRRPYINVVLPSIVDPSVAPAGKHVMSCFVQYAPYDIAEGAEHWPEKREAFGETVIDTLEEYIPGLRDTILHKHVLTPWDIQEEYGLTEGNIFHGELTLDQMAFQRPTSGWARYKTPIRDLWLGGSGAHPGGGLMGAPGALCAKAILGKEAN